MNSKIIQGNNVDVLRTFPDNTFDSIVTDPPYGISFLGKAWDSRKATETTSKIAQLHNLPSGMKHTSLADDLEFQYWMRDVFAECLRVLKPGGHLLAFSAARTYHHMAMAAQTAGFEIRDQIVWIYSSGFPKSQDVGKSIDRGSGKAAHKAELAEVKAILRQLYEDSGKSTAEINRECGFNAGGYLKTDFKDRGWANNLPRDDKWLKLKSVLGCGDDYDDYFLTTPQVKVGEKSAGCFDQEFDNYTIGARSKTVDITQSQTAAGQQWSGWGTALKPAHEPIVVARKPIKLSIAKNCQEWGVGALNIDATRIDWEPGEREKEQAWREKYTKTNTGGPIFAEQNKNDLAVGGQTIDAPAGRFPSNVIGEIQGYQKYFYCPKVSRKERHIGFDLKEMPTIGNNNGNPMSQLAGDKNSALKHIEKNTANVGNNHPTVKPIELMKYLIKLVTPAGGRVLDPFNGSGSTGCAAVELDYAYTGIELDAAYVAIAEKRIAAWYEHTHSTTFNQVFEIEA